VGNRRTDAAGAPAPFVRWLTVHRWLNCVNFTQPPIDAHDAVAAAITSM